MEEIPSLDSLPNELVDSAAKPESETSNKPNEESEPLDKLSSECSEIAKNILKGSNDEDFDTVSDASFDMDDNLRATEIQAAAVPPPDNPTGNLVESLEEEAVESTKEASAEIESDAVITTDNTEEHLEMEAEGLVEEEQQQEDKATDFFEEVDANVSGANNASAHEESDILGSADMTLPVEPVENETEAEIEKDKSVEEMDVDKDANDEETEPVALDAEMTTASDTPDSEKAPTTIDEIESNLHEMGEGDAAQIADDTNEAEDTNADDGTVADETRKGNKDDEATLLEELSESNDKANAASEEGDKEDKEDKEAEEEENAEHGDETVENVQEPEESDICLIPDDTESEMTDADKEQAILARETADQEDEEEALQAEKNAETPAEATKESGESETATTAAEENADHAEAQAEQAGAEASRASEEAAAVASSQPETEEPPAEEMADNAGEQGGASTKIIIGWIMLALHKCKQCDEEKTCGFRFRSSESNEFEYLCTEDCCKAWSAAFPGKYFIRRKKFLVEEISNESEADAEKGKGEAGKSKTDHYCIQCKESKACQYFFKQDEDSFYICNDACYNLLNAEEPDKFKLKRHSIRVRNMCSTSLTSSVPQKPSSSESRVVARTAAEAEAARLERVESFMRRCADCRKEIILGEKNLLWETMDFCNETCLGKYQRTIGADCQTCKGEVPPQALGKYCVRFGFDVRQFCCAACLNEHKKGLKTCSCCQKDISTGTEGFLAPVGDKEQFKDFCSQTCLRRYDSMVNPKKKLRFDICAVCNNNKPVRVEILVDDKECTFCSNPCFSAFKFVSNIVADQCAMCCKYFERKGHESFTIYTERRPKVFCTRICLNVFIIAFRRIVSCQWCKVKKYNFDMIYKQQDAQELLMCSLNCLTLYGVSINAFTRTVAKCDNCRNTCTPQYHLTMSDASMRNFCTYQCVMQFQSQFARAPLTLDSELNAATQQQGKMSSKGGAPFPTGLPKRVKLKVSKQVQQQAMQQIKLPTKNSAVNKKNTLPVISTVSSLASGETETMIGNVIVRRRGGRGGRGRIESPPPPAPLPTTSNNTTPASAGPAPRGRPRKNVDYVMRSPSPVSTSPVRSSVPTRRSTAVQPPAPPPAKHPAPKAATPKPAPPVQEKIVQATETKIIAVPPYPPAVRNVQTMCKPQGATVGVQTQVSTESIGTQTDKDYSNKVLIPVPVPIYLPQPMYMYSLPFPVPVPIPLPIPVPIFIPTTRNSAQGILKEIKKIQDKMPADPFEAELLMMAEMVAEEKRESDSDSEEEIKPDPGIVTLDYGSGTVAQVEVANNSYGEDVLQMALKMATGEYEQQPTVDLESAMTANTITNPPPGMVGHDDSMTHMGHQMQPHIMMDTAPRAGRGRKRGSSITSPVSQRNNRSPVKRQRLQELEPQPHTTPPAIVQPVEKPDVNMCLKYTFGVNAWKQWVMTKNSEIEKSSPRRRPFKTELLQLTADELNYSLCLFVKEVRKPNGTEYAPDTIYYLVLGIQQYLYENGRIDNIFTDPYYERFTDCLDDVARKFSVLYNDSQYIVTRVEEEHLWECKQLGAHSPHVLLSTLMFFNTKHFNLTTVEEHMQLSFSHIMKHWKRSAQNAKLPGTRNVLLRFYPPQAGLDANPRKKKVYEQQENEDNPLRCPVRLYEFYLSKCPESVKTRNDVFYLQPERSCVPDSPVWYSTQALSMESLQKMLHRVKMVKEINIALLTS